MLEISEINLLKPAQVAKMLAVSRVYVYKMAERGLIPCVRWPAAGGGEKTPLRFIKDDVIQFVAKHRQPVVEDR